MHTQREHLRVSSIRTKPNTFALNFVYPNISEQVIKQNVLLVLSVPSFITTWVLLLNVLTLWDIVNVIYFAPEVLWKRAEMAWKVP